MRYLILHVALATVHFSQANIQFTPYRPSEQYKCGSFLSESRRSDVVLSTYYQLINQFVDWISNPFNHQELLNKDALLGNVTSIQESLEEKHLKWIEWQKGWLLLSLGLIAVSVVFFTFYIFYRLCKCCLTKKSKKKAATDAKHDGCKRNFLNLFLFILVTANAFAAFTLLMTSQYGQFGLDQLPNRINQCIDDLNLYKRENDMRIRKLLIDDFRTLNRTITDSLDNAGYSVVDRVKKLTGAHVIDIFLNASSDSENITKSLTYAQNQIKKLTDEAVRFETEFVRLKNTAMEELTKCAEEELEPTRAMCGKAERLLDSLGSFKFTVPTNLIPEATLDGLKQLAHANVNQLLSKSNVQFESIRNVIQMEIDKNTFGAQNMLKQIGDDLFVVAETISTQLRQINFDPLYNAVSFLSDSNKTPVTKAVQYSWYTSLAVTSLFVLIALCFLFGVLYGICGRRPTYYNDDCCVRTTGSRFFSCGIWLTMVLFVVLAVFTAVVAFAVGNTSNLVCQTLREPLSRQDMISLVERYIDIYKDNYRPNSEIRSILNKRTTAEVIRACQRNETLYQLFELDKKYHLNQLKDFEKESYVQLENFLKRSMEDIPQIRSFDIIINPSQLADLEKLAKLNISKIGQQFLNSVKHTTDELDLLSRTREFEEEIEQMAGRPKAVSSVLEQVKEIEEQFAKPLRQKLETLHTNITLLDEKLSKLQVPVSSLLVKLQHAQALLSENIKEHFSRAAKEEFDQLVGNIDHYVKHVKNQMETDVSSCTPLVQIVRHSTAAICNYTIDPLNGSWMCMLICLLLLVPIVILSSSLTDLYAKMHAFPKYIVDAPVDNHVSSFVTDTYNVRPKAGYANFTYTDDYQYR